MQGFAQAAAAGGLRAPPCGQMAGLQASAPKRRRPVQLWPEGLLPPHHHFGYNQVNGFVIVQLCHMNSYVGVKKKLHGGELQTSKKSKYFHLIYGEG